MTNQEHTPIHVKTLKPNEPWMLLSSRTKEQDAKIQAGFRALEEAKKQKDPTTGINNFNPYETLRVFDTQIQELEALTERLQNEAERVGDTRSQGLIGEPVERTVGVVAPNEPGRTEGMRSVRTERIETNPPASLAESVSLELRLADEELKSSQSDLDRRHIMYRWVTKDRDGYFYKRLQDAGPMYDVDAPPPLTPEDRIQSARDVITAIFTRYDPGVAEKNRSEIVNTYRLSTVTVDLLIRYRTIFSQDVTDHIQETLDQARLQVAQNEEAQRQAWEEDMGLSPVVDTGADGEEEEERQEDADKDFLDASEVELLLEQVRSERARYIQEVRDILEQRRTAIERTLQLPVSHTGVRTHTGFKGDNFFGHADDLLGDADYTLRELRHDLEEAKDERENMRRHQKRLNVAEIEGLVRQFGRPSTLFGELALKADTKKGVSMLHLGRRVEDARRQAIADMVLILEKEGDIDALLPLHEKSAVAEAALRNPYDLIARAKALGDEDTGTRSDRSREIEARREFVAHLEACQTWANELRNALAQYDQMLDTIAWLNRPPQPPLPLYTPDPPAAHGDEPPDALAEAKASQQRARMTELYSLVATQEVGMSDKLSYLGEAKTIARQLGDENAVNDITWAELFYRKQGLDSSITARVGQCNNVFKSSKDIETFLQSASELTDDILSLDRMDQDLNTSPLTGGMVRYDVIRQVEALYEHGVLPQLMREDRYADVIRVGEQTLGILGRLSQSEGNTRAQMMIKSYLSEAYRFLSQYELAIQHYEDMMRLDTTLPHPNDGYDPESQRVYLNKLRQLLAQKGSETGTVVPGVVITEASPVVLSTDIPQISIPREVMEKIMTLDIDQNQSVVVAEALGVTSETLGRWKARFATQLGINTSPTADAYSQKYSRAQVVLLANIKTLLNQGWTYEQVAGRLPDVPSIATTTGEIPPWARERLSIAMKDLGLSDQARLQELCIALAELGWQGAAAEERIIQEIQRRAEALNIPVASEAVAGFSEYLLGVLAMRHGETVGDRLAELRPHLGRWIRNNLVASSELLPFLRGLKAAPIISTLINTLANEGESREEGVSISWDSLTRETMQSILNEVANRTTGSSPTDRIVHIATQVLGQALASKDSTIASEMRTVASDGVVQQVLRELAKDLKAGRGD